MSAPSTEDLEQLALGSIHEPVTLARAQEHRRATLHMVRQARRSLIVLSQRLDPAVYDDEALVEAIRQFLIGHRRARARLLVRDLAAVARRGHRLLDLTRRLSSYIEARVPAVEHADYEGAFLVVDDTGTIVRRLADRYQGSANFADGKTARELAKAFGEMWETAAPDPNVRRLHV